MANNYSYGMGQLRYSPPSSSSDEINLNYFSSVNSTKQTQKVKILSSVSGEEDNYQDVLIKLNNGTLATGEPYLLHLEIPQNNLYNCEYEIKLIDKSDGTTALDTSTSNFNYQMVRNLFVNRLMSDGSFSRVILFPLNTDGIPYSGSESEKIGEIKVAIAKEIDSIENINNVQGKKDGDVFFDIEEGIYWYFINNEFKEIVNKNDAIMNHSWEEKNESTVAKFDIIFTPRSSNQNYNAILIQMIRINYDADIFSDGVYGRKIDIEDFNFNLYKLVNLLDDNNVPSKLNSIGVYSHPNLSMAINGEEIKIGQSGYYELNDFDITSLSIYANGIEDNFTLDYQYKKPN